MNMKKNVCVYIRKCECMCVYIYIYINKYITKSQEATELDMEQQTGFMVPKWKRSMSRLYIVTLLT